jgi:formylglycine-generating enzyme required for sulfatase activity
MTMVLRKQPLIQRIQAGVLAVLLTAATASLAMAGGDVGTTDDQTKLYTSTSAVKWLAKPVPLPESEAKTEAEMKSYTEKLPSSDITFDMVSIKGGTYKIGSPESEKKRGKDEGPQVDVKIAPFWMGKYEITWDQFEAWSFFLEKQRRENQKIEATEWDKIADHIARPTKPYLDMSFGMGKGTRPAVCMTQYSAQMFCKWLTAKTGRYYRLPTEAEWEYACRAGTTTAYSFGNDASKLGQYAVYTENSDDHYAKVGTKKPNPWGLYDMHGNVAEWVLDQYAKDTYSKWSPSPVDNPLVSATTEYPRSVRGGSWNDDPEKLRSAARLGSTKAWKQQDPQIPQSIWYFTDSTFVGFRVVRPLATPTEAEAKMYEPDPQIWLNYKKAQGGKQ